MNDELIKGLMERADQSIEDAQYLFFDRKSYEAAISRAYYAIFYAAEAALLTKGETTATHKGLSALFARNFIKEGIIEIEYSRILSNVYRQRQLSDYEIKYSATEMEASEVIADAGTFVARIRAYLATY